jgi:hypothetical protein
MKQLPFGFYFLFMISFCCCKENKKDTSTVDKISLQKLELDSSLWIKVPQSWDSVEKLKIPSYEYQYYKKLSSKVGESVEVKRLKFRNSNMDLQRLSEFFKNETVTTPSYRSIRLIKENSRSVNNIPTQSLIYSFLDNDKFKCLGRLFFINADSSRTIIEVKTCCSDTTTCYKRNERILNSVEINSRN